MSVINKVLYPYLDNNGYARKILKSRKQHTCMECCCNIEKGSSYISIHRCYDNVNWDSAPLCNSCYSKMIPARCYSVDRADRDYVDSKINEALAESSSAASRITQVYKTSDAKIFDSVSAALEHETLLGGISKLILYSSDRRVNDLDSAILVYILDTEALYAFDYICKKSKLYANRDIDVLDKRDYGLFILDPETSQFRRVSNAAEVALTSFIPFMLNKK